MNRDRTALIITSISGPSPVLARYARECPERNVRFIVIGDSRSPDRFDLAGCDHWDIARQKGMAFSLAALLPDGTYARKNLGYLEAMAGGTDTIIEVDDDIVPLPAFWEPRSRALDVRHVTTAGWCNVYRYFTDKCIWPRGFPLELATASVPDAGSTKRAICPIQQGLTNGDPDVDAIQRLTSPGPLTFERSGPPIALGHGTWCPLNSQNTTWFPEAFPLLYLPTHCSFRMTDIWRGLVAQRIAWANGWHVAFKAPDTDQQRNPHDPVADLTSELPGLLHNRRLADHLAALEILPGREHMERNMRTCYTEMVRLGLLPEEELVLLEAWSNDVRHIESARPA
jgi:hypothetical protein